MAKPLMMVVAKNKKKAKRHKKKKAVNQLVTYKPSKKRGPGLRDDSQAYMAALRNPFSVAAVGARVPDSYAFPTATYHIRSTLTFTSSASGLVSAIILPSPCFSLIQDQGTVSGPTAFSNNTSCYYALSPTNVAKVLTEYRVVAWGLRVVAKDTAFSSKGKMYFALVPTTANAPSWNTLNTVTASNTGVVSEYTCGLDIAYMGGSITNLPTCRVFSMQDLLRGELQVTGLPLSASFYDFRGTSDRSNLSWNTGQVLADEGVFNNTTGLVNATAGGRKDVASLRGGMGVLLYASGLPESTNEFDVELIYHLEGSPNVADTSGGLTTPIPSSQKTLVGSTGMVEKFIATVRQTVPIVSHLVNSAFTDGGTRAVLQGVARLAARNAPLAIMA